MSRETTRTVGEFFAPLFGAAPPDEVLRANALKLIREAVEHAQARGCSRSEISLASRVARESPDGDPHSAWHARSPESADSADRELGDCLVVMDNIAYHRGADLGDLRDVAMEKNRARGDAWDRLPDGTLQHRKEGTQA